MGQVRSRIGAVAATVVLLAAAAVSVDCAQQAAVGAAPNDGASIVQEKCGRCHPLARVEAAKKDKAGWTTTVNRMTTHGLVVSTAQKAAVIDYLSMTHAP